MAVRARHTLRLTSSPLSPTSKARRRARASATTRSREWSRRFASRNPRNLLALLQSFRSALGYRDHEKERHGKFFRDRAEIPWCRPRPCVRLSKRENSHTSRVSAIRLASGSQSDSQFAGGTGKMSRGSTGCASLLPSSGSGQTTMTTLQRSAGMHRLHCRTVIQPIMDDPRTNLEIGHWLGHPFADIRTKILGCGLADFNDGYLHSKYGDLSNEDKVLLYCFVHMTQHFFESVSTFRRFRTRLKTLLSAPRPTIMVDLGCGPGTAGLALAESFNRPNVDYRGVDHATPMLRMARSLLSAARDDGLFGPRFRFSTTSSWGALHRLAAAIDDPRNLLLNATYLFASDSLDVGDLCACILEFKRNANIKQMLFTYSNTVATPAGERFTVFKRKLRAHFSSIGPKIATIRYRKKPSSDEVVAVKYVRQLLVLKW